MPLSNFHEHKEQICGTDQNYTQDLIQKEIKHNWFLNCAHFATQNQSVFNIPT